MEVQGFDASRSAPGDMSEDEMLTVEELAARLRVKASWVYRHADELGCYRLGKYIRFSWKRVLRSLEG
jgi:excisionase family DNA binding protein